MGSDETEDDEDRPAGKKAKGATPAANGGKSGEVKREPGLEAAVGEEEVSFF